MRKNNVVRLTDSEMELVNLFRSYEANLEIFLALDNCVSNLERRVEFLKENGIMWSEGVERRLKYMKELTDIVGKIRSSI